jgi:hypothetical protein
VTIVLKTVLPTVLLMSSLAGCLAHERDPHADAATSDTDPSGACLAQLIETASSRSPGNPAYSFSACTYHGATVYYSPPQCCDQFSVLIDPSCNPICAPDGGFTGRGDGRCDDFDGATCRVVWTDPRAR